MEKYLIMGTLLVKKLGEMHLGMIIESILKVL